MTELLPATEPQVFSVSDLTRSIRSLLEGAIGQVWVEGEISNLRRQSSGHQYFTLKDDRSQLSCVLFRNSPGARLGTPLDDGTQVQMLGDLTVYEARGNYQMVVQLVQPKGLGALQARFEALKRKLQAEGLFDLARKRPLPRFPLTIGLVTSPSGAALQDMLNILGRRAPWMRVLVNPARVQGVGAAAEIRRALEEFNEWSAAGGPGGVDLIVVARGGGSMEDLFEFNDEALARAIFASALPVVSAVGHEVDFTIADFVADLRAPTPSAAAELIAPDTAELQRQLLATFQHFDRKLLDRITHAREHLEILRRGTLTREPARRTQQERQRLDSLEEDLQRSSENAVSRYRVRLDEKMCCFRLAGPQRSVENRRCAVGCLSDKLTAGLRRQADKLQARMRQASGLLRVLGPVATLNRGYSITTDSTGKLIRSTGDAQPGVTIVTQLSDGVLRSTVDEAHTK